MKEEEGGWGEPNSEEWESYIVSEMVNKDGPNEYPGQYDEEVLIHNKKSIEFTESVSWWEVHDSIEELNYEYLLIG